MKIFLGSRESLTASPVKTSKLSIIANVKKLVRPNQGACKLLRPWLTISPKDADPGGSPNPKKSNPDNTVTDALKLKGKKVTVATVAFGKRWRNIIVVFDTPSARAALI